MMGERARMQRCMVKESEKEAVVIRRRQLRTWCTSEAGAEHYPDGPSVLPARPSPEISAVSLIRSNSH